MAFQRVLVLRACATVVLACAAVAAASGTATAGSTAVSSFSKSGRDLTNGLTATADGAPGATAAGDTIKWVLDYRNNSGGTAQADLRDSIVGNHAFVPGSLQVPPGFAPQWSTNGGGSFLTTEPASGVDVVRATGTSAPPSTAQEVQTQPGPAAFQSTNSGGDGYEALFVGDNIYNVHHHSSGNVLDCHTRTGTRCAGYPTSVSGKAGDPFGTDTVPLTTSQVAQGFVVGSKLYYPVGVIGSPDIGVACADVTTRTSCGFTKLGTGLSNQGGGGSWIMGGAAMGSKYYAAGVRGEVFCFDSATGTACAGYPLVNFADPGSGGLQQPNFNVQAWDNRYLFGQFHRANGHGDLICIDTTTNTRCPGYPKVDYGHIWNGSSYGLALVPLLTPSGAVNGVCGSIATTSTGHPYSCFDLSGNAVATPFSTTQTAGTNVNWVGFGSIEVIGPRVYFAESTPSGVATYTCWDYSTSSACAGFVKATSGVATRAYTLRQDAVNPDCIWEEGDADRFEVFSATFGGTNCVSPTSTVDIRPSRYRVRRRAARDTRQRRARRGSRCR